MLILSATGIPFRESVSNIEWTAEIAASVVALTATQRIGKKMAPTNAHFHQRVSPKPIWRFASQPFEEKCSSHDPQRPDVDRDRQQEQQRDAGPFTDV